MGFPGENSGKKVKLCRIIFIENVVTEDVTQLWSDMWVELKMLQRLSGSDSAGKHMDIRQAHGNSRERHLWRVKPIDEYAAQSSIWLVHID